MAEKTTSQSQKKQPGFEPLVMGMDAWARVSEESMARIQSMVDELAGLEAATYARAKKFANEFNALATDSATYALELAAEWRKMTLDATKRTADIFGAKA